MPVLRRTQRSPSTFNVFCTPQATQTQAYAQHGARRNNVQTPIHVESDFSSTPPATLSPRRNQHDSVPPNRKIATLQAEHNSQNGTVEPERNNYTNLAGPKCEWAKGDLEVHVGK